MFTRPGSTRTPQRGEDVQRRCMMQEEPAGSDASSPRLLDAIRPGRLIGQNTRAEHLIAFGTRLHHPKWMRCGAVDQSVSPGARRLWLGQN